MRDGRQTCLASLWHAILSDIPLLAAPHFKARIPKIKVCKKGHIDVCYFEQDVFFLRHSAAEGSFLNMCISVADVIGELLRLNPSSKETDCSLLPSARCSAEARQAKVLVHLPTLLTMEEI